VPPEERKDLRRQVVEEPEGIWAGICTGWQFYKRGTDKAKAHCCDVDTSL